MYSIRLNMFTLEPIRYLPKSIGPSANPTLVQDVGL